MNFLKELDFDNKKYEELKRDFLEMAQLKSDFDIEKFTVAREGNFIAHQYHFLMRQYHLAAYEFRRLVIEREEKARLIKEWQNGKTEKDKFADLEIEKLKNDIDLIELSIVDKIASIKKFEEIRQALIKKNGGKITNKQYQEEEPDYWRWFLIEKAKEQEAERRTGISAGVWENIRFLEADAILNKNYKVKVLEEKEGMKMISMD